MNAIHATAPRDGIVLILGVGETGAAAARWCARQGMRLRVADSRSQPPGIDALRAALQDADVQYVLGADAFTVSLLDGVHQLVLSPGLVPQAQPQCDVLHAAADAGVEIVGEIELFARALRDLADTRGYAPRILAVTGTNGKTTVTSLARHMAEAAGMHAVTAGNIGPAALEALMHALEADSLPQVWVIELSSFQLETTGSLVPDAAIVLNLSQDHLDWHGSEQAYAAAKARIFRQARMKIVNRDDPAVLAMIEDCLATDVRSFGRDIPVLTGDLGLDAAAGMTWLCAAEATELDGEVTPLKRKKNAPAPTRAEGRLARLMPADALQLRGLHNASNVLAALALCRALDLGWGPLLRAARSYEGEPHRTAFVRAVRGVDFINDSKGTNVGATVAALDGMGQPVVLIAGGLGKGQDFAPLARAVARATRAVVLIGQDAALIGQSLADAGVPLEMATDMTDAIARAFARAEPGDAVLLSPACASMDMFRNYVHRGQVFAESVNELALDQGEVA